MNNSGSLKKEDETNEATLKAIQRATKLIEEQVIPKLAEEPPREEPTIEIPIPPAAEEALAKLYRSLTAAPAAALKSMFSVIASEPHQEGRPGRAAEARGIALGDDVTVGRVGKLLLQILERYPQKNQIKITSALRPGWPDHHGGKSYKGSPTAAVDIIGGGAKGMRDVAKWLYDNYGGDIVELIHTTPFPDDDGFYINDQKKYPGGGVFTPADIAAHRNHVHFATSKALAEKILKQPARAAPAPPKSEPGGAPVWGWDASSHDWKRGSMDLNAAKKDSIQFFTYKCSEGHTERFPHFKESLDRARKAGIPVLGAYHVLWPGNPLKDAHFFFSEVNSKIPWWKEVPWIWQLDAEPFEYMPRAPNPEECKRFLDELRKLAGNKGYFIAYAPEWHYKDTFKIGYDLWASNYTGSGQPRNFKEQYKGVPQSSWHAYSGRKPRILQFASDATIGTQKICDANRFDGTLAELIQLTGHKGAGRSLSDRIAASSRGRQLLAGLAERRWKLTYQD